MKKLIEREIGDILLMSSNKRYKYYLRTLNIASDNTNEMQKLAIEICRYIEERYPDTLNTYIGKIKPEVIKLLEEAFNRSKTNKISHNKITSLCCELFNKKVIPPFVCRSRKTIYQNKFTAKGLVYFGNYQAIPGYYIKGANSPKYYNLIKCI